MDVPFAFVVLRITLLALKFELVSNEPLLLYRGSLNVMVMLESSGIPVAAFAGTKVGTGAITSEEPVLNVEVILLF